MISEFELLNEFCKQLRVQYGIIGKVLFVQVPQINLSNININVACNKGYYAFPPTGLQFLYEACKNIDVEMRIIDLNLVLLKKLNEDKNWDVNNWITIFEDYLDEFQPDFVCVSCLFDVSLKAFLDVLQLLVEKDESVICTGGIIPTFEWKNLLERKLCHFVVRGEGENLISLLLEQLRNDVAKPMDSANIAFVYQDRIIGNNNMPAHAELSGDLIDSYLQIHLDEYYKYGSLNPFSRMAGADNVPYAPIEMSRGCRGRCSFCAVHGIKGTGVRHRSVDVVFNEMKYLVLQRGVKHFEWLDDDLLCHRDKVQQLLQRIIDSNWKITWAAGNGLMARSIDELTLQLMKNSGCIGFRIGIESGNPEMLIKIKKPGTLSDFRRVANMVNKYEDIFVGGNYIIGLPDETFGQMCDSFNFALELNIDWASISVCQVVRGASAFSDCTDYFDNQFESHGTGNVTTNLPTRGDKQGYITSNVSVKQGYDIFSIDSDTVPNLDQTKEIWFTFNLILNFIYNKNLCSNKNIFKFIHWVEMAQKAHPANGYMSLFLGLAFELAGNRKSADKYFSKARDLNLDKYWASRFREFNLDTILENPPCGEREVVSCIETMREKSSIYFKRCQTV